MDDVMKTWKLLMAAVLMACGMLHAEERRLSLEAYRDKMEGGWLGQIIGVCWGGPTEFRFNRQVIPDEHVPKWKPELINQAFGQDDLYVEMTFIRSMEEHGIDVSIRQAGIDFANSRYGLWCANKAGRDNLRFGIAPPDSSHPKFNKCPNDIDYQIEADYSGLLAPGMPQVAIQLGEKFGRLMNYGDGVYAGQFMGGMYAEAFFSDDIETVVKAGLACIPSESQYAEMVRDMMAWHHENPTDWQATWKKAVDKYGDKEFLKQTNGNIDVRLNGAVVLLGLLYGEKDMEKTVVISMRGGFDSDCNPSSSGGVLGTMLGKKKLEERFIGKLDRKRKFWFTEYNVDDLIAVCEKLAVAFLKANGGRVEDDKTMVIPIVKPTPSPYQPSWNAGPIANSMFTDEEMDKITVKLHPAFVAQMKGKDDPTERVQNVVDVLFPGWKTSPNAPDMTPGYVENHAGRQHVLRTHPLDKETGAILSRTLDLPVDVTALDIVIAPHGGKGDFTLIGSIDGKQVLSKKIQQIDDKNIWQTVTMDLRPYAGKRVTISLNNFPDNWFCEAAYWAELTFR